MPTKEEKLRFYQDIERIVVSKQLDYFEAIIHHCETSGMEIETAASLVNEKLKKSVEYVVREQNMLKKNSREKLPI